MSIDKLRELTPQLPVLTNFVLKYADAAILASKAAKVASDAAAVSADAAALAASIVVDATKITEQIKESGKNE